MRAKTSPVHGLAALAFVALQLLAVAALNVTQWVLARLAPSPGFAPRLPDELLFAAGALLFVANVILAVAALSGTWAERDPIAATGWLVFGGLALLGSPLVPLAITCSKLGNMWPLRAC
jgi:hypothetical protein